MRFNNKSFDFFAGSTRASKMIEKIDRILELLSGYENYCLVDQKINCLTAAGENYGSLMLAIEIILKNKKTGDEKILKTVAKLMPPNEFIQKVFNSQVSFKSEIGFYESIVPVLQNFRRKSEVEEMDIFAHSYGSRINLNGSDVVDDDGILILENLKEASKHFVGCISLSGYINLEKKF